MPRWTDDLADQIAQAIKKRGLNKCPVCGSVRVELSGAFYAQMARPSHGLRAEGPTGKVPAIDDSVYVNLICVDCGYRRQHQMKRLGPFDLPKNDGLWLLRMLSQ
ncbi:MAG: hypothetical protein ACM3WU_06275 [Bacillota bacterium]